MLNLNASSALVYLVGLSPSAGMPVGVPPGLAATGVLPMDAALREAWRLLMEVAHAPAARVGGSHTYTDGSVVDGRDPLLARASWAAVLVDEAGVVTMQGRGSVEGPQTALRVELAAALWVAEGSAGQVPVGTDCDYVHAGAAALRNPAGVDAELCLHRGGSDLWDRILVVLPRSRRTLPQPVGRPAQLRTRRRGRRRQHG